MSIQGENFRTVYPKNELISKHISYYYFHDSLNDDFSKNVLYHPHYLTSLNVYRGTQIKLSDFGRTYMPHNSKKLSIIYTINKKNSREVRLRGRFDKIGIIFNPLGINHFIDQPLSQLTSDTICNFEYFGDTLHEISNQVFKEISIDGKRDLLDNFFLDQFIGFDDSRIKIVLGQICNSENTIKTQDLAKLVNVSRETLLRIFQKHLCYSVEEFKAVFRFRNALEYYEESQIKPKLTEVAAKSFFYDQSDFVKHFKKVTGLNPKKFFSSLRNISNAGTYWTFKD